MSLDRPGLDRARELIEAGEVAVVAQAAHWLTIDENGVMRRRDTSIHDCGIHESERRIF